MQQPSLKHANTSFEWLMQSRELGDRCLLFNFWHGTASLSWANFLSCSLLPASHSQKLRASLVHFWLHDLEIWSGDWRWGRRQAGRRTHFNSFFVQIMVVARKTDETVCDWLICGLLGKRFRKPVRQTEENGLKDSSGIGNFYLKMTNSKIFFTRNYSFKDEKQQRGNYRKNPFTIFVLQEILAWYKLIWYYHILPKGVSSCPPARHYSISSLEQRSLCVN